MPHARQPVHVLYGGAHLFRPDIVRKCSDVALRAMDEHGFYLEPELENRIREKLRREPVEAYCIDFEDGYGSRSEAEEDGHAEAAALAAKAAGELPPYLGIRIKPLGPRAIHTLQLFLKTLAPKLPANFSVTLPKVTSPQQVEHLVQLLETEEGALGLEGGPISIELLAETPQGIQNLSRLVEAAQGRCTAVHFGPYDFTSAFGIVPAHQGLRHPSCVFARNMMQLALAGSGVRLADGPTKILPLGDSAIVRRAWKLHYDNVRASLSEGFYQSWDLHPAQLPSRYAAIYGFFLENLEESTVRLRNFLDKSAQATRIGEVFDDTASVLGLLNFFVRAVDCGAISREEAEQRAGWPLERMRRPVW